METKTAEETIGYFYNEKGDYTITLRDEPVAFTFDEQSAVKLVNSYKSLLLRVDVLSKMEHSTSQYKSRIEELEKELAEKKVLNVSLFNEIGPNRKRISDLIETIESQRKRIETLTGLLNRIVKGPYNLELITPSLRTDIKAALNEVNP